jgi:hypothetical protein
VTTNLPKIKNLVYIWQNCQKIQNFGWKSDDLFQKIIGICNKIFPFVFLLGQDAKLYHKTNYNIGPQSTNY